MAPCLSSLFSACLVVRFGCEETEMRPPSVRKLRPPNTVSHSKAIRIDGYVITSRGVSSLLLILNAPPSLSTWRVGDGVRSRDMPRARSSTLNLKAASSMELLQLLMYAALRN